jgi:hypothetical protein
VRVVDRHARSGVDEMEKATSRWLSGCIGAGDGFRYSAQWCGRFLFAEAAPL